MRNPGLRIAAIALAVVSCSLQRTVAQEKAEDAIRETLHTYGTAWNAGDARSISNLYTVDADYTGFGSVMTRGRDEIAQRYESLFTGSFSGSHLTIAMSSLRFLKPDVALVDGSFDLAEIRQADGTGRSAKGLFVAIMTNDEGQWRFTAFWSKRLQSQP
jgi:uncharacterized protein (TIGR02246 family)